MMSAWLRSEFNWTQNSIKLYFCAQYSTRQYCCAIFELKLPWRNSVLSNQDLGNFNLKKCEKMSSPVLSYILTQANIFVCVWVKYFYDWVELLLRNEQNNEWLEILQTQTFLILEILERIFFDLDFLEIENCTLIIKGELSCIFALNFQLNSF